MDFFRKLKTLVAPNQQERINEGMDLVNRRNQEEDQLIKEGYDPSSFKGWARGMVINPPQVSDVRDMMGMNSEATGLNAQNEINRRFGGNIDLTKTTFDKSGLISGQFNRNPEEPIQPPLPSVMASQRPSPYEEALRMYPRKQGSGQ